MKHIERIADLILTDVRLPDLLESWIVETLDDGAFLNRLKALRDSSSHQAVKEGEAKLRLNILPDDDDLDPEIDNAVSKVGAT